MNQLPNRDDLRALSEERGDYCVSIYMPTARRGVETLQGPVRLKNLLRQAEEKLTALGARPQAVTDLTKEARRLVDAYEFWQFQSDGLALFIRPSGEIRTFQLPMPVNEEALVNNHFHLKALMQVMTNNGRFYLLAGSQRSVRLFEGTRFGMTEMPLPEGTPRSLEEAMQYEDWSPAHHMSPGSQGRNAGGISAFAGHGADASDIKDVKTDLLQFFMMVDKGVHSLIGTESAPLIFAGLEYLHPIYHEANNHSRFLEDVRVTRAVDDIRPEELHELAWAAVEPIFRKEQEDTLDRFHALKNKGLASSNLHEVVPAAVNGRVESLLFPVGEHRWGVFETESNKVQLREDEISARGEDLIDLAAVRTFVNGGSVFALQQDQMPDDVAVAAVYRY